MSLELHCHTLFSVDGRGTPEALVESAAHNGVSLLAVTDHNNTASYPRVAARATELGLETLCGIELDAFWGGETLHFLGLGVDPTHPALRALSERHLARYARLGAAVSAGMNARGFPPPGPEGLSERYPTHPAPVFNPWYLRDYFRENPAAKAAFYPALKQAVEGEPESWASFPEVRDAVRAAGGLLLLAHVARFRPGHAEGQAGLIKDLLEIGMDGFELYHPSNTADPAFPELRALAERLGCPVSGGSDSHAPGDSVGSSAAPEALAGPLLAALRQRGYEVKTPE